MPGSWQMAHKYLLNKQRHDSHPLACRRGSRPPGSRGTGLCPQGKLCGVQKPLGTKGPLLDGVCMSLWSPGCGNSCNPSLDPVTRGDRNPHQSVLPALPVVLLSTGQDLPANACVSKPLLRDVSAKVCLPYSPIKGSHIFPSRPANGYPIATRRLGYTSAGDNAARCDDRVDEAG